MSNCAKAKALTGDIVQISKKFEELPVKEQRRSLFETLKKSRIFSDETIKKLMRYKDKNIPLIKELYEITKNDELFSGDLAFYDMQENDLPARIEFYKKYKEEQHVTIEHDLNMLCHINRYNLPLAKLIGIKGCYDDNAIKLIQNTSTKEEADTKIEGYSTLYNAIFDTSIQFKYEPSDLYKILIHMEKCHLPLLKRMCGNKNYLEHKKDIIGNLNRTGEDNIEAKLKIFDLMEEAEPENNDPDVLRYTDNKNYQLVEFLVKDQFFPWESISKVATLVEPEDCTPKIEIYNDLNKYRHLGLGPYGDWASITNIMYRTNRYNIDYAKTLVKDKNIIPENIAILLSQAPSKELTDMKFYAYNHLKDRKDIKNNPNAFANAIQHTDEKCMNIFNALEHNPKFNIENIANILYHNINTKEKEDLFLKLINETPDGMTGSDVQKITDDIIHTNLKLLDKICFDEKFSVEDKVKFVESTLITRRKSPNINDFLFDLDLQKPYDNYKKMHQTVINYPEIYINGEDSDEYQDMIDYINYFFDEHMSAIIAAAYIFDLKTLDDLFRMRFDFVEDYLDDFINFSIENLALLKSLCDSKNVDGKPLSSKQKIEMLDMLEAYRNNNMSLSKIHEMAGKGVVNIEELNSDLLKKIFANMKIDVSDISKEKLLSWNLKHIHLLAQELEDCNWHSKELFNNVINAANLDISFKDLIQDPTNKYGSINKATMLDFKKRKMNYDKWVNSDKKNNVHFVYRDNNREKLSQISDQIEEDINTLLHSIDEVVKNPNQNPVRKILWNNFAKYFNINCDYSVQSDQFYISDEFRQNKTALTELVKAFIDTSKEGPFSAIWDRANQNLNNPEKRENAAKTLMILNHLAQRQKDLDMADRVSNRNLDLTIKMWDRIPQKDLFQGNFTTCCIGMNECNGWSMPVYLLNTAFNMIELVDNITGETIGNALCYFTNNKIGHIQFIIDNIEIKNSVKPSDEVGIKLRDAITEYAKNIVKDVAGENKIKILLGTSYNDVPDKDLPKIHDSFSILGAFEEDVYTDAIKNFYDSETGITVSNPKALYMLS